MKVRSAIRKFCPHCYIVKRGKTRFVYCTENGKHKQRQGFHTLTQMATSKMNVSYAQVPMMNMNVCHFTQVPLSKSPRIFQNQVSNTSSLLPSTRYVPSTGLYCYVCPV